MTHPLQTADQFDVAIIGGGAAGVLVAIHLLAARRPVLRITIIEPRAGLGQGAAYSTVYSEHLLNVVASRLSAFPDDPGHFVRYLATQPGYAGDQVSLADCFARRVDFGCYLSATLDAQPGAGDVQWLHDEATDIQQDIEATITLGSGARITARSVVLALGNFARAIPLPATDIHGEPSCIAAWDYAAIRQIDRDADVCILGSGLSMIDAVLSLAARAHRGNITVISRHGLMPLAHVEHGTHDIDIGELARLNVRQRTRALRAMADTALINGEPWQWIMDSLRPHVQLLWTTLPLDEQRRFLRHVARFWDIHRHRIAPAVVGQIEALRSSGQLQIRGGRLLSIAQHTDGVHVRLRANDGTAPAVLRVDHVINSTGVEKNITRLASPLVASLVRQGLITPGPHEMGVATKDNGTVLAKDGSAGAPLVAVGAMRIGHLWESTAIAELRGQATRVADMLA
ncbi:MAG: FAD/NAD(P)-binding protein [Thermomonas sp.]